MGPVISRRGGGVTAGPRHLLLQILEQPELVSMVRSLDARALGRVIDHVGLEDAGELISLATTEQLVQVFDADLWSSDRPGEDETFDADRFAIWLEVLLEAGEGLVARRLIELPEDLVMLALSRFVLVINLDELALEMSGRREDVDVTDKALDSCLYHEFDEYQVISRRHNGWDAVVAALAELNERHFDFLQRILARCCHATTEYIEDSGGLYSVLTSEEMLESDAAADREDRRARQGFVSPSSAAAFLRLARDTPREEILAATAQDPVTRAYFRELEPAAPPGVAGAPRRTGFDDMLEAAGASPAAAPGLITGGEQTAVGAAELFTRTLRALHARDPARGSLRTEELAYLANVLMSVGSLRAVEAAEAAASVCEAGLGLLLADLSGEAGDSPARALERTGLDKLFRAGWRLLHEEPDSPAAVRLRRMLKRSRPAMWKPSGVQNETT